MNEQHQPQTHVLPAGLFLALAGTAIAALAWFGVNHSRNSAEQDKGETSTQISKAIELGQKGEYTSAALILNKIVKKHPDNVDAMFNLGIALSAQENYSEAERMFVKVNRINPKDYDAVAERAGIMQIQGEGPAALALLETIPPGAGNISSRLAQDPRWAGLGDDPRMRALLRKHGVKALSDGTGTSSAAH